jgi:hypothetical protein
MNNQWGTILLVAIGLLTGSAHAQGSFINLDFESASLVPVPGDPYGRVQLSSALPGWTGCVDGTREVRALYDNKFLDSSGIGLMDTGYASGFYVRQGSYAVLLQAGVRLGTTDQPADVTLSQTGVVPDGSQSLLFDALFSYGRPPTSFAVKLGGQALSLVPLSNKGNFTLYGADIHTLAGQTAELNFTLFSGIPHIDSASLAVDSIRFSTQPIPEPGVPGLLILGGLIFGLHSVRGFKAIKKPIHSNS